MTAALPPRSATAAVAVVTGAAGAIGAATARALAADGFDILLNHWQTRDAAADVAASIVALGRRVQVVEADVGAEPEIEAMFAVLDRDFGRIDCLVHAAGIARAEDIFETTLDSWNAVLRTNLTGAFLTSRAAMVRMRAAGSGRIIHIGSVVGHQGALKGHCHYGASKAGLNGFAKSLARTAAPLGITVNVVAPGIVDTQMLHATHGESGVADLMKRVPLGTLASPEDVAAAVVYLAGPSARHVTGAILDVNGGMLMR